MISVSPQSQRAFCILVRRKETSLPWQRRTGLSVDSSSRSLVAASMTYRSYDYEVFGKVQGVFFRSSTVDEAKKLGVVGWVQNTSAGTVQGQVQGKQEATEKMKTFLKEVGSPSSRIDKVDFKNEKEVGSLEFKGFEER